MMRILFMNRMASMVRGGGETFDLEMARHLETLGVQTSFLSGAPMFGPLESPLDHPRSMTIRSPYTGWFPWDRIWQGWRLRVWDFRCFETRAARWVARHQNDYDIVQICEMPPLVDDLLRNRVKIPIVMRITAPDYHDPDLAVKRASAIIASGTSIKMLRQKLRPDAHDVPNGVDTQRFCPENDGSAIRREHGIPADAFVMTFVARFHLVKNHAMLIDAFKLIAAQVGNAHLVLVGAGPLLQTIQTQVSELDLQESVHFLHEVPYERVPEVYAAADLNVIASNYESFSFAALEGMATGLPMVVTDTEWVPNLIGQGQGGVVVPKNNALAFAEAVLDLFNDATRRAEMGAWNRQRVLENYQWQTSAQKLHSIYESLIAGEAHE